MESKYIFFNELEFDGKHMLSLDFRENEKFNKYIFLRKKQYFITTVKALVRMDSDIEKWNDYDKIVK